MIQPVAEADRIASLDVLRGFALLGILLLNIIGFAFNSSAYSNPGHDLVDGSWLDVAVWALVEVGAEGAMRCLFSVLFGAGILLFSSGAAAKSGVLHYRRTFWLLLFGLFDAYILLWSGDILVTYALAGALLYLVRDASAGRLLAAAISILALMSLFYLSTAYGLGLAFDAAQKLAAAVDTTSVSKGVEEAAAQWQGFADDFAMGDAAIAQEYAARRASYATAFLWNVGKSNEMIFYVMPLILFWDALAMMLLGMAFYKFGILQGDRSSAFYARLMIVGFTVGLCVNGYEVTRAYTSNFDLFATFAQMQPTYHVGRLGMACGYVGLLILLIHKDRLRWLRGRLASVGRMALTNYLMQSLICLFLFTGAGFALVGEVSRAQSYVVVFAIWAFQVYFSQWWLTRYRYGPMEWLWRALTYANRPTNLR